MVFSVSISNLEEHYRKILGYPEAGNLEDLEKKYQHCVGEFRNIKESDGLHLSAIQQNGEINNAYLYLKALWSIDRRKRNKLNLLDQFTLKAFLKKFTLEAFHHSLSSMAKAAVIVLALSLGIQAYVMIEELPRYLSQAKMEQLNASLKAEAILRKDKFLKISNKTNKIPGDISEKIRQPEIIIAAKKCDLTALRKSLKDGQNIRMVNYAGETALHWAARMNCIELATYLIEKGANSNQKDNSGKTPLQWANDAGNLEMAKILNIGN